MQGIEIATQVFKGVVKPGDAVLGEQSWKILQRRSQQLSSLGPGHSPTPDKIQDQSLFGLAFSLLLRAQQIEEFGGHFDGDRFHNRKSFPDRY